MSITSIRSEANISDHAKLLLLAGIVAYLHVSVRSYKGPCLNLALLSNRSGRNKSVEVS